MVLSLFQLDSVSSMYGDRYRELWLGLWDYRNPEIGFPSELVIKNAGGLLANQSLHRPLRDVATCAVLGRSR